jgi:WD40 repeat protein
MTRLVLAGVAGLVLTLSPTATRGQQPQPIVLRGPEAGVGTLAFSPDGKTVAVGDNSKFATGRVRLWDVATGKERAVLEPRIFSVQHLAYAPDGKTLAVVGDAGPPMGSAPGMVVLWDLAAGKAVKSLHEPTCPRCLAFSNDGRVLVTGGAGVLRTWDVATGKVSANFKEKAAEGKPQPFDRFTGAVVCLAFAPGDALLATAGGGEPGVRLWDVAKGQELARLSAAGEFVQGVAFSPDGSTLAAAGGLPDQPQVRLWDVGLRQERAVLRGHKGHVSSVAYSRDGRWLATAGEDGTVRLRDSGGAERHVLQGHKDGVLCLAFSPDSRTLASGGVDGTVRLWPVPGGK